MSSGSHAAPVGFALRVVPHLDSTTAELLRAPLPDAPPGTALLALSQSEGRGRSDRVWVSGEGGLYLSIHLKVAEPQGLSLLGAMALIGLLESAGLSGRLRWPNDVMVAGRKLGGVLPVVRYQGNVLERAILGVGCNVHQPVETFPSGLRGQITTLAQLDPTRCWQVLEVAEGYLRILHSEWSALEREGLPWLCRRAELYLEGSGDGRTPVLTEPGRPPLPLPSVVGLTSQGALRLEDGMVLDHLGREQRLRFLDEL